MSGRLIILPKKSYCPWNPKNVEVVLRDEREHAEKEEKERKRKQQDSSRARLEALKGILPSEDGREDLGHVNLFEEEEKQHLEQACETKEAKKVGIMPLYLGRSVEKSNRAFYLQKPKPKEGEVTKVKDEKLKTRMDPMSEFHLLDNHEGKPKGIASSPAGRSLNRSSSDAHSPKICESKPRKRHRYSSGGEVKESSSDSDSSLDQRDRKKRRRRRRHPVRNESSDISSNSSPISNAWRKRSERKRSRKSHRRHRKDKGRKVDASDDGESVPEVSRSRRKHLRQEGEAKKSMEELRRRRTQREQRERERQDLLIRNSHSRGAGRYKDQYNPRLSRI